MLVSLIRIYLIFNYLFFQLGFLFSENASIPSLWSSNENVDIKIASKSTALARLAKETVNVSYETTLNEGLRAERAIFMSTFSLEDHKEGMEAFSEKRKPNWKNK